MTRMEQPSLDGNGKKKGYIRIMKELWDAKGYGDLGLSSQNLRDHAARLEKTLQESTRNLPCDAQTEGAANSRAFAGGDRSDGSTIAIPTSIITDAYNEISTWRKNVFLVPYGKVGRDFIDQITSHINDWNSGSDNQHICLKAAFVLLALVLQKPNAKSKAKDHQDVLSTRLTHWRQGEINKLLREGRIIQGRIEKLKASDPPDRSKVFAKLVLEG